MTSPCLTPCSGDAFSDSTFGEGWELALIFAFSPFSPLPLRSPSLALAVRKLPVLPTPAGGCFLLFSTPAPSVLSSLALSEQMHLLCSWARSPSPASARPPALPPPPPAPALPTCPGSPRSSSPPPRGALTLQSRVPAGGRGASCQCADDPAADAARSWCEQTLAGKASLSRGMRGRESPSEPERAEKREKASVRRARFPSSGGRVQSPPTP